MRYVHETRFTCRPSCARNGHIAWFRLRLHIGDQICGWSEELVSRCIECDIAEPESLASLGGSAPGLVDGILSPTDSQRPEDDANPPIIQPYWEHTQLSTLLSEPPHPG